MRIRNEKGKRKITCKCGELARPGQRYCKECHTAYMRKWRQGGNEDATPGFILVDDKVVRVKNTQQ